MDCREENLEIIKKVLNENPKINAVDLVKKTNLSSKTILEFINDGTLTAIDAKPKKKIKGYYSPKEVSAQWHIAVDNFFKSH